MVNNMRKLKEFVYYIFAKLFGLFPLKNYIVLESNSDFSDNSKALYDYLIKNKINENYKIFWAVSDININNDSDLYSLILKRFYFNKPIKSIKFLYVITRAKYCFYTHYLVGNRFVKNQVRCFLMHGTSLKNLKNVYNNNYDDSTHAVVTSEFTKEIHNKTKNGIGKLCHILGYPRNDALFVSEKKEKEIKEKLGLDKDKKIIIWMPTFKHQKGTSRNDLGNCEKDLGIIDDQSLNKMDKILEKNNACLIIKLHPAQDLKYVDFNGRENIKWLTNEELFKKNVEVYPLLGISDGLITDFSSVYTDYLLLDKPIGFELSNLDNYKKGLGFSVDDPLDYMPGEIIKNEKDLIKYIEKVLTGKDEYKEEREKIKKIYHKYEDNNSSSRVAEFFGIRKEDNNEEI